MVEHLQQRADEFIQQRAFLQAIREGASMRHSRCEALLGRGFTPRRQIFIGTV